MAAGGPAGSGWARFLVRGPDMLAAAMLLALTAVTFVDVLGRELHGLFSRPFFARIFGSSDWFSPLKGGDELTVVFMAISVYAVFASITWREEHVCVDLIDMVWPKHLNGARQIALNLIAAVFMAIVTWRVWFVAGRLAGDGERTEYLQIPKGPLTYFFAVMCALATLCLLANCVRYVLKRGPLDSNRSELEIGKHRID
jgi:TRAP-type C4-dicarboxylate transport system permease small subunit